MVTPAEGLARLRAAAESGELDALCERYRVRILTVFGSTGRGEPDPRDLDVAVVLERVPDRPPLEFLHLIMAIEDVAGREIDFADVTKGGPVIRENALVGSVALYESEPGALATAQIAAVLERMDTAWMRRLDLDLLAG